MNQKPKCPACQSTEFEWISVSIKKNEDYWNPVICKNCGTIVGQLPSDEEYEMFLHTKKLLTIEEHLGDIKYFLFDAENRILKK